jgi:hypothetical protein
VTIDTATFPEVTGVTFWTASRVIANGVWDGSSYWTIDFQSGLVSTMASGTQVLCVQGGP